MPVQRMFLLLFTVTKVQVYWNQKCFERNVGWPILNVFTISEMTDKKKLKSIEIIVNDDIHKKR